MSAHPTAPADEGFEGLLAPGESPDAQLQYLRRLVQVFHHTQHPKLRQLRRRLDAALAHAVAGYEAQEQNSKIAKDLVERLDGLRLETFAVLHTVVNQVRGTIRSHAMSNQSPADRAHHEQLHEALTRFGKGLKEMMNAAKNQDVAAVGRAQQLMDDATQSLEKVA